MSAIRIGEWVVVEWVDAVQWQRVTDPAKLKLMPAQTGGILIVRNNEIVALAQSRFDRGESLYYREVQVVPTIQVQAIRRMGKQGR